MTIYGSPTRVVGEILTLTKQTGQQGIRPRVLQTNTNLSYLRLSKFVEKLTDAGLIATKEIEKKNAFVITPKGREYLEAYRRFMGIAESYGLEL
ncbi:winged helix-turn-helix domain-containing protein [archaeon]|nr:winged helix-turn-helix domain-containing protein [archaeon]